MATVGSAAHGRVASAAATAADRRSGAGSKPTKRLGTGSEGGEEAQGGAAAARKGCSRGPPHLISSAPTLVPPLVPPAGPATSAP